MTVSVIVPIGDEAAYATCRASLARSMERDTSGAEWQLVEVRDAAHRGVAWARNEGLAKASGDWVAWVDCDDEVLPEWCGTIARAAAAMDVSGADVLCFGAEIARGGRAAPATVRYADAVRDVATPDYLRDVLRDVGGSTWLWNKVFRRGLFDGLRFEGETQEDFRIMPRVLSRARVVRSIPNVLYRYVRPAGSLTHAGGGARNARGILDAARDPLADVPDAPCVLPAWREGCALRAADGLVRGVGGLSLYGIVWRGLWSVLADRRQSLRVKAKCILAALGWRWRRDG